MQLWLILNISTFKIVKYKLFQFYVFAKKANNGIFLCDNIK